MERKEFLQRRRSGIGGSDIAAIARLSPWRSPADVYLDKLGLKPEEEDAPAPVGRSAALYWGSALESELRKAYTAVTGRRVMRYNRLLRDKIHPYFIGDVDALAYCEDGRQPFNMRTGEVWTDKGVELKTARMAGDEWGEEGSDAIPPQYICQVQWYMGLMPSVQSFDVAVLFGGSKFCIYTVCRSELIIRRLREVAFDFWRNHVEKQIPPEPMTAAEVAALWQPTPLSSITASSEIDRACRQLARYNRHAAKVESYTAELRNRIAVYMRDNEALIGEAGELLATFKTSKNGRRILLLKNK